LKKGGGICHIRSRGSNCKFRGLHDMKSALTSGIIGKEGSYLADLLLRKGCDVHRIIRRSTSFNTARIDHIYYKDPHKSGMRLHLIYGDTNDATSLNRILGKVAPDEVYNLEAQSHVCTSFDIPKYTSEVARPGTPCLPEGFRETGLEGNFYLANSSELYEVPQRGGTPFYPRGLAGRGHSRDLGLEIRA
jgi:GDPmannose 4,6-dehydratase